MLFSDPEEAKIKAKIWPTKLCSVCVLVSENELFNHIETYIINISIHLFIYVSIYLSIYLYILYLSAAGI